LQTDSGSKSLSQPSVIDAGEMLAENMITSFIVDRDNRLTNLISRPDKKARCRRPPPSPKGVEFFGYRDRRRLI
jgi:hypothetical protein